MRLCKLALALGVLAIVSAPAMAQRGGGFGRGSIGALAANKNVQEELKVNDDTKTKIDDAVKKVREDNKDDLAKLRDQNTSREDRTAIAKKLNEDYGKALKDVLSADQMKRLKQIVLQQEGLRMFANEDVKSALKLTDDQTGKIKTIGEDLTKEMADLRGTGRPTPEARTKMAAAQKEAMGKAKDTLTGDQKKSLDDLLGKPFEVKFEGGRGGRGNGGKPRTDF